MKGTLFSLPTNDRLIWYATTLQMSNQPDTPPPVGTQVQEVGKKKHKNLFFVNKKKTIKSMVCKTRQRINKREIQQPKTKGQLVCLGSLFHTTPLLLWAVHLAQYPLSVSVLCACMHSCWPWGTHRMGAGFFCIGERVSWMDEIAHFQYTCAYVQVRVVVHG